MLRIIGIDTGRYQTKTDTGLKFPSIISEWYELTLDKTKDYELSYDGKKYFVGELAREGYCRTQNASRDKIHEEMKLLFLTSLAAVEPKGETVIVTGVPVDQHREDVKRKLREYLKGSHQGMLNRKFFKFTIKTIEVAPEGAAAFWDYVLDERGRIIRDTSGTWRVVDIGSKTVNVATIIDKQYLNRESFTLDYGCFDYLNAKSKDKKQFAKRIMGDLMQRWTEYKKSDNLLFSGGGSLLLKDYVPGQIVDDPVFANARGFKKLGVAKWGGM